MKKQNTVLFLSVLFALMVTFMGDFVAAAPVDNPVVDGNTITLTFAGHTVTVHGIVFSVICFISGAYLCFLGGVYQSFTIFVVGFYWGANIAYIILSNAKADYGENTATILLVVSVVVGLLVGGLLCCCFFLAVYLLGGFFGFIIAMWILSWSTNGLIQTNWGRAILIVCLVIAGMVLIAFLEKPVFIIGTAFIGSFVIFLGVDIYVKSGLLEMVDQMIHARSLNMLVTATPQLRGLLGGIAGLTVVGSLIQWCLHRGRDYRRWNERYTRHDGYGWRRV